MRREIMIYRNILYKPRPGIVIYKTVTEPEFNNLVRTEIRGEIRKLTILQKWEELDESQEIPQEPQQL